MINNNIKISQRKTSNPDLSYNLIRNYFNDVSSHRIITPEEMKSTFLKARDGCPRSRELLVLSNLRLVISIAKNYLNCGIPLMDLIQEGNIGLIKAIEKYDPDRGTKFSTYAVFQIRHHIIRSIANKSRLIRLPVNLIEKKNKIEKIRRQYLHFQGINPDSQEISQLTDYPADKITEIDSYFHSVMPLDTPLNPLKDDASEFFNIPSSDDPEIELINSELTEKLKSALNILNSREKEILIRYFGLKDSSQSLKEIGKLYQLTRERIRQIKEDALQKLRNQLELSGLIEAA